MNCTINDLKTKEVINISDGARLGFVSDAELDLQTGRLTALVIPGGYRFMGILGRESDITVPWENIEKIGDDIILVSTVQSNRNSVK